MCGLIWDHLGVCKSSVVISLLGLHPDFIIIIIISSTACASSSRTTTTALSPRFRSVDIAILMKAFRTIVALVPDLSPFVSYVSVIMVWTLRAARSTNVYVLNVCPWHRKKRRRRQERHWLRRRKHRISRGLWNNNGCAIAAIHPFSAANWFVVVFLINLFDFYEAHCNEIFPSSIKGT